MKLICTLCMLLATLSSVNSQVPPAAAVSPTESRIADDRRQIAETPARFQPYNDLALALVARVKETADSLLYTQAEQALNTAVVLSPNNFQVLKTRVVLLLAKKQFLQARVEAKALNAKVPDDVSVYGYLATADIELGDYADAETQAQWMLNLLPNNVSGLLIGARLREIYSDPEGALEFLNQAYQQTPSSEIQELAEIGEQMARVQIHSGKIAAAEQTLQQVLQIFPGYPAALGDLATAKAAKSGHDEAEHLAGPEDSLVGTPKQSPASSPIVALSSPAEKAFQPVPRQLLTPMPTETDRLIRSLQAKASREPDQYKLYAQLGAAFFQKARETGDVSHFELAEQALRKSLDLTSNDLAAAVPTEIMAEVYMGEHRFADALASAEKALSLGSGDLSPFEIVGDAYADMGEYDNAIAAYNKLTGEQNETFARDSRIAFIKFISGDTDVAIDLMQRAIANGAAAQLPAENLAWLYYELGEFCFQNGKPADADRAYLQALTTHPGDYRALAGMARLRANQGLYSDAIELYQKALAVVPMPLFAAELGDVYTKAGRTEEAKKQFRLVEYMGTLGAINKVLHNRDLALFYADHDINLPQALELAKREFEVRHDIYTWDVLAWVLYKNGKVSKAAEAAVQALRFHSKDALLLFHAGMIMRALGEETKAREYLSQAVAINPHFHVLYAESAAQQLAELNRLVTQPKIAGR